MYTWLILQWYVLATTFQGVPSTNWIECLECTDTYWREVLEYEYDRHDSTESQ